MHLELSCPGPSRHAGAPTDACATLIGGKTIEWPNKVFLFESYEMILNWLSASSAEPRSSPTFLAYSPHSVDSVEKLTSATLSTCGGVSLLEDTMPAGSCCEEQLECVGESSKCFWSMTVVPSNRVRSLLSCQQFSLQSSGIVISSRLADFRLSSPLAAVGRLFRTGFPTVVARLATMLLAGGLLGVAAAVRHRETTVDEGSAIVVDTSGRHLGTADGTDRRDEDTTSSTDELFFAFWLATLSGDGLNLTALRVLLERSRRSLVSLRSHILTKKILLKSIVSSLFVIWNANILKWIAKWHIWNEC